ncbi:MAG TPA: diaminopropionate ammonia-lyase, partial [Rhizobiales bacterium]|nr:diaminopropionate ammonia-lyase [Hyphomicrobiales bacterium]
PLGGDPSIEAGESAVAGLAALIMASNHNELRSKLGLNEQSSVLLIGSEGITDPLVYQQLVSEVVNA